jgi:hypothetical protein
MAIAVRVRKAGWAWIPEFASLDAAWTQARYFLPLGRENAQNAGS